MLSSLRENHEVQDEEELEPEEVQDEQELETVQLEESNDVDNMDNDLMAELQIGKFNSFEEVKRLLDKLKASNHLMCVLRNNITLCGN